jgi:IMP dehydrogenase
MGSAYTYSDVLIKPKYSEILSREDVVVSTTLGPFKLTFPVIPSNMKTITGPKMATTVIQYGGMGILHRFCTIEENTCMFASAKEYLYENGNRDVPEQVSRLGVSIGVKDSDRDRFHSLYTYGARLFCIDVAHGHHVLVKNMLRWIKMRYSNDNKLVLIVGNVATPEGYEALVEWGADIVKVGIGPGAACETRRNAGVGIPQLYALESIYEKSLELKKPADIIADGGITCVGDVAKAMKYSNAVMIGSMIAGTSETPGNTYRDQKHELYKEYGGSASGENRGENRFVEGATYRVVFQGKVKYVFDEIKQGLQSACSYVGAQNLKEYQQKCEFINISSGSRKESKI